MNKQQQLESQLVEWLKKSEDETHDEFLSLQSTRRALDIDSIGYENKWMKSI